MLLRLILLPWRSSTLTNVPSILAKTVNPSLANRSVSQCQLVKMDDVHGFLYRPWATVPLFYQ